MAEESFLLVSLQEDQAKKLAQVISNDTSRKILDFLSKNTHGTESQIANDLDLPLSTVHYNMQHLAKAKLVNTDEYTYSKKGKEIIHYSLANKYVIIAPAAKSKGMLEKLKSIFPAFLGVSLIAGIIQFWSSRANKAIADQNLALQATREVVEESAKAAPMLTDSATGASNTIPQTIMHEPNLALWFLCGGIIALGILLVISLLKKK